MLKRKIKLLIIVLLLVNTASVKSVQSSSSVIRTYYEPALDYNDYVICNPQNKNGSGLFNDLMSFLNSPNGDNTKQPEQGIQKFDQYKIYPIPTNDQLTIEYDFVGDNDASFILVDILGREMLQTSLKSENTMVSISTLNLPLGVYMYKIHVGKECYNGKIIKR